MRLLNIPESAYNVLNINTGGSYDLGQLASAAINDEVHRMHERDREAHESAGHKLLCGWWLPTFQRGEVWSIDQKRKFVESVIMKYDCGSLMITNSSTNALYDSLIIDGQQRLTAIRDFALGKFNIFNDVSYKEFCNNEIVPPHHVLYTSSKSMIYSTYIQTKTIKKMEGKEELLKQFYNDLNFSGVRHTEEDRA